MNVLQPLIEAVLIRCREPKKWAEALQPAMKLADITTPVRVAAFIAQVGHESSHFNHLSENLFYSAAALRRVWPKRFPTIEIAQAYEHKPELIANFVYANRLGNGDRASGDGWRYRGRGLIQLTGRANYAAAGQRLDLPLVERPEMAERPTVAALSAADYWDRQQLNKLADAGSFETLTRRINGGLHGLEDRVMLWERAKKHLGIT